VPGVVGKVGTTLGRGKVNIGNFALGRSSQQVGAEAIAVVQVDTPAPEAVLEELRQLPEIQEVREVHLTTDAH
jgi:D-3-phosphoglycerate dehydrogenase